MKTNLLNKNLLAFGLLSILLSIPAQTLLSNDNPSAENLHTKEVFNQYNQTTSTKQLPDNVKENLLMGLTSATLTVLTLFPIYRHCARRNRRHLNGSEATHRKKGTTKQTLIEENTLNEAVSDSSIKNLTAPKRFSILIADDNSINRLLLANQLRDQSEHITTVKDGIEALYHLKNERFNLVFLDLQMPGHNGFELIEMIRHDENPNQDTPIIAVTAHALPNQCKDIIDLGFDECLIKPVLSEQLEEIITLWRPDTNSIVLIDNPPQTGYAQQILAKTANDRDLALSILNKLCEELPQQLQSIQTAINQKQWQHALSIAHKLHGSVSFCGLSDIRARALALEQNLISKNYPEIDLYFADLKELIEQFIVRKSEYILELSEK